MTTPKKPSAVESEEVEAVEPEAPVEVVAPKGPSLPAGVPASLIAMAKLRIRGRVY